MPVHKVPCAVLSLPPKYSFTKSKLRFWRLRKPCNRHFLNRHTYCENFFKYMDKYYLTCIIHKLSITMLNYRQNTSVLIKFDLKIVHYFLHQICLRLLAFFDIWTSHDENLWIKQVKQLVHANTPLNPYRCLIINYLQISGIKHNYLLI